MDPARGGHPLTPASLISLYRERFGAAPESVTRLRPDGSARLYFRLLGDRGPVVGALGEDVEENRAFLSFSRTFRELDLPVPEILAVDEGVTAYLLTDLGDTTLFDALSAAREGGGAGRIPGDLLDVYRRVVGWLPRFQVEGGARIDFSVAYPRAAFDRQSILWDLNYFKYLFLRLAHVPFHEARLEKDFGKLADVLTEAPSDYFLYRDFQSRNVMVIDGQPWFIDYQGGRRGALQYDVAALLYDAKADLPEPVRADLLEAYLDALAGLAPVDRDAFLRFYRPFVLVRILQALGAYGYRGYYERKPRFLESVPYAAANIRALLDTGGFGVALPELEAALRRVAEDPAHAAHGEPRPPGLTVTIGSFSYKRGLPADGSGHGGGFVFDCRAIPNPGRRDEFRERTGLDADVQAFLAELPESEPFWESVRTLVEAQVEAYRRRGFDSLTVQFGCTGGQHRSVYFAERLAAHLRPLVRVEVRHRERDGWPGAPARAEEEGPTVPRSDGATTVEAAG